MIKEFLDNLDIVATSPMAFVAYIFVLSVWAFVTVKKQKLKFIENVIHSLNYEDKVNTIYHELDVTPSSISKSPEQWLKHKKHKYTLTAFLSSIVAIIISFAISTSQSLPESNDFEKLTNNKIIEKGIAFTNDYFLSLTNKSFAAEKFFAPDVERFFTMKNTTRKAIQYNIETEYYPDFKDPALASIPNTWSVINKYKDSCIVTFEMLESWYSVPQKRTVSLKSLYLVKFDKYFRFYYFHAIKVLRDSRKA